MNQAPAQTSKNLGLSPMEGVVAGIVVGLVLLSFIFYLTGEISGTIFKFNRPGTPVSQVFQVTGGVISHPANPAKGWPTDYQSKIPGPIPFYLTLMVLCFGLFFLIKYLHGLWAGVSKKDLNQAQWARAKDIKTLIVPHAGIRGRLVLGRSNGKLIATEPRQSVIVMGPTQTGKTTGFAVPAILEWDGPVIAASVKNDLVKDTFKWRRTQGEVWLFDPTRSTGFDYEDVRAGWSPLSEAQHWGGARKVASWLCKANKAAGNNLSDGDFWFSAAEKLMAPFLFAAAVGGKDMATVLRWIDTQEEREIMAILQRAGEPSAMTAFEANVKRDERTKSSIFTTAETIIDAYNDPLVCESAANPTIFSSELLNGGKNTLYICAPSHEQERLQAIFTAIVSQMKSAAYELAGKQNKPVDPPLLICIDEAANIAPLNDLDSIASTAAGIGIQLVTIFQDMAQIEARYKERARTVVNNHRAKVILSGISDTGTLEYVSKLCGEEEVDQQSTSIGASGERSTTDSKQQRTLASGAFLRRMKFGEGIVVYGQLSPAKLVLRQWFKDRVLKHMVEYGTKPGVMGGPSGSNSFDGAPVAKDTSEIPSISAVSADTHYTAGDMPTNQMTPGISSVTAPPAPTSSVTSAASIDPTSSESMSAFDKALAELRARDASGETTTSLPIAAVPTAPASKGSPPKWKPTSGGTSEDPDDVGGFSSVATQSTAEPKSSTIDTQYSSTGSSSKWSKGSRPDFADAKTQSGITSESSIDTSVSTVPASTGSPSKWKPAGVVTPTAASSPTVETTPVGSTPPKPLSPTVPSSTPPVTTTVPASSADPAVGATPASHISLPSATPIGASHIAARPGESVSGVFAQYGVSPQSDGNNQEETPPSDPESSDVQDSKPKWK